MYFSHICHFRPMTQPNPLKTQIIDPFPTQPNPTQPAGQPNPWTTLGWSKPHTHSIPKLALFGHKITHHRFNQGLILLQGAQIGAGAEPPAPSL